MDTIKTNYETWQNSWSDRQKTKNQTVVLEDENFISEKLNRVVVASYIYGSQNYELDTPDSDYDTKVVVMPNLQDLISGKNLNRTLVRKENYSTEFSGIIQIFDFRTFLYNLTRGNYTELEFLYSKAVCFCSATIPDSKKLSISSIQDIISNRNKFVWINPSVTLNSIYGHLLSYKKRFVVEKKENRIDVKSLANIIRMYSALQEFNQIIFNNKQPTDRFFIPNKEYKIAETKAGIFSEEECKQKFAFYTYKAEQLYEDLKEKLISIHPDTKFIEEVKQFGSDYIKTYIKKEILDS